MITSGRVERSYPMVIGVLAATAAIAVLVRKPEITLSDSVKDLFTSAINVGAIAAGFIATMQSILMTTEKRIVGYLKEADKFGRLVDYLLGAIALCMVVAVFSALVLFLEQHKDATWYRCLVSLWTGLALWAVLSCYRAFSIMSAILKN